MVEKGALGPREPRQAGILQGEGVPKGVVAEAARGEEVPVRGGGAARGEEVPVRGGGAARGD